MAFDRKSFFRFLSQSSMELGLDPKEQAQAAFAALLKLDLPTSSESQVIDYLRRESSVHPSILDKLSDIRAKQREALAQHATQYPLGTGRDPSSAIDALMNNAPYSGDVDNMLREMDRFYSSKEIGPYSVPAVDSRRALRFESPKNYIGLTMRGEPGKDVPESATRKAVYRRHLFNPKQPEASESPRIVGFDSILDLIKKTEATAKNFAQRSVYVPVGEFENEFGIPVMRFELNPLREERSPSHLPGVLDVYYEANTNSLMIGEPGNSRVRVLSSSVAFEQGVPVKGAPDRFFIPSMRTALDNLAGILVSGEKMEFLGADPKRKDTLKDERPVQTISELDPEFAKANLHRQQNEQRPFPENVQVSHFQGKLGFFNIATDGIPRLEYLSNRVSYSATTASGSQVSRQAIDRYLPIINRTVGAQLDRTKTKIIPGDYSHNPDLGGFLVNKGVYMTLNMGAHYRAKRGGKGAYMTQLVGKIKDYKRWVREGSAGFGEVIGSRLVYGPSDEAGMSLTNFGLAGRGVNRGQRQSIALFDDFWAWGDGSSIIPRNRYIVQKQEYISTQMYATEQDELFNIDIKSLVQKRDALVRQLSASPEDPALKQAVEQAEAELMSARQKYREVFGFAPGDVYTSSGKVPKALPHGAVFAGKTSALPDYIFEKGRRADEIYIEDIIWGNPLGAKHGPFSPEERNVSANIFFGFRTDTSENKVNDAMKLQEMGAGREHPHYRALEKAGYIWGVNLHSAATFPTDATRTMTIITEAFQADPDRAGAVKHFIDTLRQEVDENGNRLFSDEDINKNLAILNAKGVRQHQGNILEQDIDQLMSQPDNYLSVPGLTSSDPTSIDAEPPKQDWATAFRKAATSWFKQKYPAVELPVSAKLTPKMYEAALATGRIGDPEKHRPVYGKNGEVLFYEVDYTAQARIIPQIGTSRLPKTAGTRHVMSLDYMHGILTVHPRAANKLLSWIQRGAFLENPHVHRFQRLVANITGGKILSNAIEYESLPPEVIEAFASGDAKKMAAAVDYLEEKARQEKKPAGYYTDSHIYSKNFLLGEKEMEAPAYLPSLNELLKAASDRSPKKKAFEAALNFFANPNINALKSFVYEDTQDILSSQIVKAATSIVYYAPGGQAMPLPGLPAGHKVVRAKDIEETIRKNFGKVATAEEMERFLHKAKFGLIMSPWIMQASNRETMISPIRYMTDDLISGRLFRKIGFERELGRQLTRLKSSDETQIDLQAEAEKLVENRLNALNQELSKDNLDPRRKKEIEKQYSNYLGVKGFLAKYPISLIYDFDGKRLKSRWGNIRVGKNLVLSSPVDIAFVDKDFDSDGEGANLIIPDAEDEDFNNIMSPAKREERAMISAGGEMLGRFEKLAKSLEKQLADIDKGKFKTMDPETIGETNSQGMEATLQMGTTHSPFTRQLAASAMEISGDSRTPWASKYRDMVGLLGSYVYQIALDKSEIKDPSTIFISTGYRMKYNENFEVNPTYLSIEKIKEKSEAQYDNPEKSGYAEIVSRVLKFGMFLFGDEEKDKAMYEGDDIQPGIGKLVAYSLLDPETIASGEEKMERKVSAIRKNLLELREAHIKGKDETKIISKLLKKIKMPSVDAVPTPAHAYHAFENAQNALFRLASTRILGVPRYLTEAEAQQINRNKSLSTRTPFDLLMMGENLNEMMRFVSGIVGLETAQRIAMHFPGKLLRIQDPDQYDIADEFGSDSEYPYRALISVNKFIESLVETDKPGNEKQGDYIQSFDQPLQIFATPDSHKPQAPVTKQVAAASAVQSAAAKPLPQQTVAGNKAAATFVQSASDDENAELNKYEDIIDAASKATSAVSNTAITAALAISDTPNEVPTRPPAEKAVFFSGAQGASGEIIEEAVKRALELSDAGYQLVVSDVDRPIEKAIMDAADKSGAPISIIGTGDKPSDQVPIDLHTSYQKVGNTPQEKEQWIINNAKTGVFFWDGKSTETMQLFEKVKAAGKPAGIYIRGSFLFEHNGEKDDSPAEQNRLYAKTLELDSDSAALPLAPTRAAEQALSLSAPEEPKDALSAAVQQALAIEEPTSIPGASSVATQQALDITAENAKVSEDFLETFVNRLKAAAPTVQLLRSVGAINEDSPMIKLIDAINQIDINQLRSFLGITTAATDTSSQFERAVEQAMAQEAPELKPDNLDTPISEPDPSTLKTDTTELAPAPPETPEERINRWLRLPDMSKSEYDPQSVAMFGIGDKAPEMKPLSSFMVNGLNPIPVDDQRQAYSAEAYYQAKKFSILQIQNAILAQKNAAAAASIADKNIAKADPLMVVNKASLMFEAILAKTAANYDVIAETLAKTGDKEIVEHSLKDSYFGAAPGKNNKYIGQNILGKLWMRVREIVNEGGLEGVQEALREIKRRNHEIRMQSIEAQKSKDTPPTHLATLADVDHSQFNYKAIVDGFYDKDQNRIGYAYAVYRQSKNTGEWEPVHASHGALDITKSKDLETSGKVGGQLKAVVDATQWAISQGIKEIQIAHDFRGVKAWATSEWNANKSYTKAYANYMRSLPNRGLNVTFEEIYYKNPPEELIKVEEYARIGSQMYPGKSALIDTLALRVAKGLSADNAPAASQAQQPTTSSAAVQQALQSPATDSQQQPAPQIDHSKYDYRAFVDASYRNSNPSIGFGYAIYRSEKGKDQWEQVRAAYGAVDSSTSPELASGKQIGGELKAAMEVLDWAKSQGITDITIGHDYEGVAKWATGEWKAKKPYTQAYRQYIEKSAAEGLNIRFEKIAANTEHAQNKQVDKLAKLGTELKGGEIKIVGEEGPEIIQDGQVIPAENSEALIKKATQQKAPVSTNTQAHGNRSTAQILDSLHHSQEEAARPEYRAFVDGSFRDSRGGFGIAIYRGEELLETISGGLGTFSDNPNLKQRNILGEIAAVSRALEWAESHGIDRLELNHDLENIAKWATGEYKANTPLSQAYVRRIKESTVQVSFRKVKAHSKADTFDKHANDLADYLAALGTELAPNQEVAAPQDAKSGTHIVGEKGPEVIIDGKLYGNETYKKLFGNRTPQEIKGRIAGVTYHKDGGFLDDPDIMGDWDKKRRKTKRQNKLDNDFEEEFETPQKKSKKEKRSSRNRAVQQAQGLDLQKRLPYLEENATRIVQSALYKGYTDSRKGGLSQDYFDLLQLIESNPAISQLTSRFEKEILGSFYTDRGPDILPVSAYQESEDQPEMPPPFPYEESNNKENLLETGIGVFGKRVMDQIMQLPFEDQALATSILEKAGAYLLSGADTQSAIDKYGRELEQIIGKIQVQEPPANDDSQKPRKKRSVVRKTKSAFGEIAASRKSAQNPLKIDIADIDAMIKRVSSIYAGDFGALLNPANDLGEIPNYFGGAMSIPIPDLPPVNDRPTQPRQLALPYPANPQEANPILPPAAQPQNASLQRLAPMMLNEAHIDRLKQADFSIVDEIEKAFANAQARIAGFDAAQGEEALEFNPAVQQLLTQTSSSATATPAQSSLGMSMVHPERLDRLYKSNPKAIAEAEKAARRIEKLLSRGQISPLRAAVLLNRSVEAAIKRKRINRKPKQSAPPDRLASQLANIQESEPLSYGDDLGNASLGGIGAPPPPPPPSVLMPDEPEDFRGVYYSGDFGAINAQTTDLDSYGFGLSPYATGEEIISAFPPFVDRELMGVTAYKVHRAIAEGAQTGARRTALIKTKLAAQKNRAKPRPRYPLPTQELREFDDDSITMPKLGNNPEIYRLNFSAGERIDAGESTREAEYERMANWKKKFRLERDPLAPIAPSGASQTTPPTPPVFGDFVFTEDDEENWKHDRLWSAIGDDEKGYLAYLIHSHRAHTGEELSPGGMVNRLKAFTSYMKEGGPEEINLDVVSQYAAVLKNFPRAMNNVNINRNMEWQPISRSEFLDFSTNKLPVFLQIAAVVGEHRRKMAAAKRKQAAPEVIQAIEAQDPLNNELFAKQYAEMTEQVREFVGRVEMIARHHVPEGSPVNLYTVMNTAPNLEKTGAGFLPAMALLNADLIGGKSIASQVESALAESFIAINGLDPTKEEDRSAAIQAVQDGYDDVFASLQAISDNPVLSRHLSFAFTRASRLTRMLQSRGHRKSIIASKQRQYQKQTRYALNNAFDATGKVGAAIETISEFDPDTFASIYKSIEEMLPDPQTEDVNDKVRETVERLGGKKSTEIGAAQRLLEAIRELQKAETGDKGAVLAEIVPYMKDIPRLAEMVERLKSYGFEGKSQVESAEEQRKLDQRFAKHESALSSVVFDMSIAESLEKSAKTMTEPEQKAVRRLINRKLLAASNTYDELLRDANENRDEKLRELLEGEDFKTIREFKSNIASYLGEQQQEAIDAEIAQEIGHGYNIADAKARLFAKLGRMKDDADLFRRYLGGDILQDKAQRKAQLGVVSERLAAMKEAISLSPSLSESEKERMAIAMKEAGIENINYDQLQSRLQQDIQKLNVDAVKEMLPALEGAIKGISAFKGSIDDLTDTAGKSKDVIYQQVQMAERLLAVEAQRNELYANSDAATRQMLDTAEAFAPERMREIAENRDRLRAFVSSTKSEMQMRITGLMTEDHKQGLLDEMLMRRGKSGIQMRQSQVYRELAEEGLEFFGMRIRGDALEPIGKLGRAAKSLQGIMFSSMMIRNNLLAPIAATMDSYESYRAAVQRAEFMGGFMPRAGIVDGSLGVLSERRAARQEFMYGQGEALSNSYSALASIGGRSLGRAVGAIQTIASPAVTLGMLGAQLGGVKGGALGLLVGTAIGTGGVFLGMTRADDSVRRYIAGAIKSGNPLHDLYGSIHTGASLVFDSQNALAMRESAFRQIAAREAFERIGLSQAIDLMTNRWGSSRVARLAAFNELSDSLREEKSLTEEEAKSVAGRMINIFSDFIGNRDGIGGPLLSGNISFEEAKDLFSSLKKIDFDEEEFTDLMLESVGATPFNEKSRNLGAAYSLNALMKGINAKRPELAFAASRVSAQFATPINRHLGTTFGNALMRANYFEDTEMDQYQIGRLISAISSVGQYYAMYGQAFAPFELPEHMMDGGGGSVTRLERMLVEAEEAGDIRTADQIRRVMGARSIRYAGLHATLFGADVTTAADTMERELAILAQARTVSPRLAAADIDAELQLLTALTGISVSQDMPILSGIAAASELGIFALDVVTARRRTKGDLRSPLVNSQADFTQYLFDLVSKSPEDFLNEQALSTYEGAINAARRRIGAAERVFTPQERDSLAQSDNLRDLVSAIENLSSNLIGSGSSLFAQDTAMGRQLALMQGASVEQLAQTFGTAAKAEQFATQAIQAANMARNWMARGSTAANASEIAYQLTQMSADDFSAAASILGGDMYAIGANWRKANSYFGFSARGLLTTPLNTATGAPILQYTPSEMAQMGMFTQSEIKNSTRQWELFQKSAPYRFVKRMGYIDPSLERTSIAGLQAEAIRIDREQLRYGYEMGKYMRDVGYEFDIAGGQIDDQGFVRGTDGLKRLADLLTREGIKIKTGSGLGFYEIQDRMTMIQREKQDFEREQAEKQLAMGGKDLEMRLRHFNERFDLNLRQFNYNTNYQRNQMMIERNQQLTVRDWDRQNMQFARNVAGIEFGWQMQDFDRNIRYARGRERVNLLRERDRAVTRFSMQEGQRDREEQRFEIRAKWEDELFERSRAHFEQNVAFQQEEMEMTRRHFLERLKMDEESFNMRKEANEREKAWLEEMRRLEDQYRMLSRESKRFEFEMQNRIAQTQNQLMVNQQRIQHQLQGYSQALNITDQMMNNLVAKGPVVNAQMTEVVGRMGELTLRSQSVASQFSTIVANAQSLSAIIGNIVTRLQQAAAMSAYTGSSRTADHSSRGGGNQFYADGGYVGDYLPANSLLRGFAEGGFTGYGFKYEPKGIVHAGEYVVPQDGALVIRGGDREQTALLKEMIHILKQIAEQRAINLNATINTRSGEISVKNLADYAYKAL